MQILEVAVRNTSGLHARPCARLVQFASRFRCEISLIAKGRRASARNILALLMLSASFGTTVRVEVDGPDEATAIREIATLFANGFDEHG